MEPLTALALDVNAGSEALGNETFDAAGATFVRNRALPLIYNCNHVSRIAASSPAEIEGLLTRADGEFEGFTHRRFDTDFRTPPEFVARLVLEGYERSDALILLLDGTPAGAAPTHEIRPVATNEDWAAYDALFVLDWLEYRERTRRPADAGVAKQMVAARRIKQPPARFWLAYVAGRPVAYLYSWEGLDGLGQAEDLFTHPDFRHRGIATALIHHCVADCRQKGARAVIIAAEPSDTPKRMYAAMGFRPVAVASHYLKLL